MGIYINPRFETKESWLFRNGLPVKQFAPFEQRPEGTLPVVLVCNPGQGFSAAGICDSAQEQEAFTLPSDHRPKRFYYVSVEQLKKVGALSSDWELEK